jgi:Ca2+-binding RTX toxin-like protein
MDHDDGTAPGYTATFTGGMGSGSADLSASSSDEVIFALGGDDRVSTGSGNDVMFGGSGNDTLFGGDGNDSIYGGTGDDFLYGQNGDDTFYATSMQGNDSVNGGSGWTDVIELSGFSGDVTVDGNMVDGEGWTMVLDGSHLVTGQTLDSIELTADAVGTITFDDGGTIDFTGIDRINF